MSTSRKMGVSLIVGGLAVFTLLFTFNLSFRRDINNWFSDRDKVDLETSLTERKKVEDTARSLITNYEAAKSEFETYKVFIGTEDSNKEQRALDARTSANMTASKYNNYLTKNNYVFKSNLPNDIPLQLATIGE